MYIKKTLSLTTDGAGAASGPVRAYPRVARLLNVKVADAQFDDLYDLSVTDDDGRTLYSHAAIAAAVDEGPVGGAAVAVGKAPFTVTVANGGATQTGTIILLLEA